MTGVRTKIDLRRKRILEQLSLSGKITVTQLSGILHVTAVTIRNDLAELEQAGHLMRIQGGAVQIPNTGSDVAGGAAQAERYDAQKRAIGAAIARLVRDGDTLFMNSGTTSEYVAEALRSKKDLNIVTNSLHVARKLGKVPGFRVLLTGGQVNAQYGFTYGADAQEQLGKYQAEWAILSVDGIGATGGITTRHAEEAVIDRLMADSAKYKLIVADHSKIGHTDFSRVMECDEEIFLITPAGAPAGDIEKLMDRGVHITYA